MLVEFIRLKPMRRAIGGPLVIHNNFSNRTVLYRTGDDTYEFLPYQLSMVRYWLTMVVTGNRELGFDSGEGALETAPTSKEGSRRANYQIPIRGGSDKKYH